MFEVYFGAFDIVMYAFAAVFAIYLADASCDEMEEREQIENQAAKEVNTTRSAPLSDSPVEKGEDLSLILDSQLYELRGQLVVRVDDVPIGVPGEVKTFSLRGDPVIRLADLQKISGVVAIDAGQVIHKWEQWSKQQKKKPKKRHRNPVKEAASLNKDAGHELASDLPS